MTRTLCQKKNNKISWPIYYSFCFKSIAKCRNFDSFSNNILSMKNQKFEIQCFKKMPIQFPKCN